MKQRKIDSFINFLYERVFIPLLNYVCLVMLVITCINIFCRYFLNYSFISVPELTIYLYIFIVFIGSFLGIKGDIHIGINVVVNRLPNKIKRIVKISTNLTMLIFFIFLVYLGFKFSIIGMSQKTQTLGISRGWIYLIIPIGAIFMFVSTFMKIEGYLKKVNSDKKIK